MITNHSARDRTACMMRIRNESRWIYSSLIRTFEVCREVAILDDDSQDTTVAQCIRAVYQDGLSPNHKIPEPGGARTYESQDRVLHLFRTPFRPSVREYEEVNEIRDKNFLWYFAKSKMHFDHMLCLDGDEVLSAAALRVWDEMIAAVDNDIDVVTFPFIYLWDAPNLRRIDGIYRDLPDGMANLRFPRLISIKRVAQQDLFDMHFKWEGTRGGFHCGSIPQAWFRRPSGALVGAAANLPIFHYGYIDNDLRQHKFKFYNEIDPNNEVEGGYKHIIGEPDRHAPGPVQLVPWSDL